MDRIGLSSDRLIGILSTEIAHGKVASAEGLTSVIARAIEENNAQLLADIKKLLDERN